MRKLISICAIIIAFYSGVFAQDVQFSQFYSNPLYLGPSFAGAARSSRVCANYRDQWVGLPNVFRTFSFSYDHYFSDYNSGVGFLAYKDAAGSGELGTLSFGVQYSYNFKVSHELYIRPGISMSYMEYGIAWDKLDFIDEVMSSTPSETVLTEPLSRTRDGDLSLSTLVYTEKIWAGVTVDHILRPNASLYADETEIPVKVSVYGGYEMMRRGKLLNTNDETMTFAFLFKNQGDFNQLDLGVYWHKNPFVLGIWYRGIPPFNSQRGDALIVLVGYKTQYFNIGYSYDLTVSNLIGQALGSHELSMNFKFAMPRHQKKGEVPCPEF